MIISLAAALAFAGCAKELEAPEGQDLHQMSFSGRVDTGIGTRTALSDYSVVWTTGDHISVFSGDGTGHDFASSAIREDATGLAGGLATFTGAAEQADTYYALYPYNASATMSGSVVTTVLPTVQTAVANSFATGTNISAAKTEGGSNTMQFLNAGAIMSVSVGTEGISSITLSSGDRPMSGTVSIDMSGDVPVMSVDAGGATHIRLEAPVPAEGEPETAAFEPGTTYYFVVAPGEYGGLSLEFENASSQATCTKTTTAEIQVTRNGNKNLGTFTISDDEWVQPVTGYELDGKAEIDEFVAGIPDGEEVVVPNLTVTGRDVTGTELASLSAKISAVTGTVIFDGIGTESTDEWLDLNNFMPGVDCRGSIIFRNINNIVNPLGFAGYTAIGGDFIIENCPNFVVSWTPEFANISEISGDFILRGVNKLYGSAFSSLRRVGGSVELSGITGVWSLADVLDNDNGRPMMQIEQIGGDLVIRDNETLWSLHGFEKLIHVGGNVVISGNNPKLPEMSGNVDGSDCIGLCLIKDLLNTGAISAGATITLATGEDSHSVDIGSLSPCNPDRTARSYVLNGEAELRAFVDAEIAEKETVYDLTVLGEDFTQATLRDIDNRVAAIEGTLTFTDLNTVDGSWFDTDQCLENINMRGSIVFRNIECSINPNGLNSWTTIPGSVVIENCPGFRTSFDGWRPFTNVTEVGGDVKLIGPFETGLSADFMPTVRTIGGDFHIEGIDERFWEYRSETLTEIGGDLVIRDCAVFCNGGAAFYGFSHLTRLGGNVIIDVPYTLPKNDYSPDLVGICIFNYYKENGRMSPDATISIIDGGSNGEPIDMTTVGSCGGPFPEQ